jgi:hypothetical protein
MGSAKPDTKPDPYKVNSLILTPEVDPVAGSVAWEPLRSFWNGGCCWLPSS